MNYSRLAIWVALGLFLSLRSHAATAIQSETASRRSLRNTVERGPFTELIYGLAELQKTRLLADSTIETLLETSQRLASLPFSPNRAPGIGGPPLRPREIVLARLLGINGPRSFVLGFRQLGIKCWPHLVEGLLQFMQRENAESLSSSESLEEACMLALGYREGEMRIPLARATRLQVQKAMAALSGLSLPGVRALMRGEKVLAFLDLPQLQRFLGLGLEAHLVIQIATELGKRGPQALLETLKLCTQTRCTQGAVRGFLSTLQTQDWNSETLVELLQNPALAEIFEPVAFKLGSRSSNPFSAWANAFTDPRIRLGAARGCLERADCEEQALFSILSDPDLGAVQVQTAHRLGFKTEIWLSLVLKNSKDPRVRTIAAQAYLETLQIPAAPPPDSESTREFEKAFSIEYESLGLAIRTRDLGMAAMQALRRLPYEKQSYFALLQEANNPLSAHRETAKEALQDLNPPKRLRGCAGRMKTQALRQTKTPR